MSISPPVVTLKELVLITAMVCPVAPPRTRATPWVDPLCFVTVPGLPSPKRSLLKPSTTARREVVRVLTVADMPVVHPAFATVGSPPLATRFLPLQGEEIYYPGQPVAMVLADSLEAAEAGAELVQVTYRRGPFIVPDAAPAEPPSPDSGYVGIGNVTFRKGDAPVQLAQSPFQAGGAYVQPSRHNNPMEPSATLALWQDGRLTVFDSVQHVYAVQTILAAAFGLDATDVRVIAPHTGGVSEPKRTCGRTKSLPRWRPRSPAAQ
jgi:CO/xanthine dehydrogenase Mo-binding subunit